MKHWTFQGTVTKIIDGDTLDVDLDLGFCLTARQRLRIKDFDAPETFRPRDDAEKVRGQAATYRASELLPVGSPIQVETFKAGTDIYGRYTAVITLPDGRDFGRTMAAEGHSK